MVYFAGYKKMIDRYKVEEIEKAADLVIWCSDEAPGFKPTRPRDRSFVGNIVDAMVAYGMGDLGETEIALNEVDRLIAIGSDGMMRAVARARHGVLEPYLQPEHKAIGSINSPMQCMMKEICAQFPRPCRPWQSADAPAAEWLSREADRAMDRPLFSGSSVYVRMRRLCPSANN